MMDMVGLDFETLPFLQLFLGFTVFVTLFHLYLDVRQLKVVNMDPYKSLL